MEKKHVTNADRQNKKSRSSMLPFDLASAQREALLIGSGFSREDLSKPLVGIINQSPYKIHPGHTNLRELAEYVKLGVREAGGVPVEMDVGGFCDGVMLPNSQYIFVQRNLITNMIELSAEGNLLDALVLLSACDKNVPAALMGAARTNLPSIMVLGGVMAPGICQGNQITIEDVANSVGKVKNKEMSESEFSEIVNKAVTGGGSCCTMTTGTTLEIITEALGMCLPRNSSLLGVGNEIQALARESGRLVMKLWERDIRPRNIITETSIANAIKVCLAVGGSIHALYHVPAIAIEAGLKIDTWDLFDKFSREIPTLVGIVPNGDHNMEAYDRAGGTPALMKVMEKHLSGDPITVTGEPIRTYFENATVSDSRVIHPLESPWKAASGLAIMRGNLATGGSVLRVSGVLPSMMQFRGKAKVFTLEPEAIQYIHENEIVEPTVMVVPNQGLVGGPGIKTLLPLTGEIVGRGLEDRVAVVTDGRLSGGARGLCIALVSPESALGGGIALVRDDDVITIDVAGRRVDLEISDDEFNRRRKSLTSYKMDTNSPLLEGFTKSIRSLNEGGVEGTTDRGKYFSLAE